MLRVDRLDIVRPQVTLSLLIRLDRHISTMPTDRIDQLKYITTIHFHTTQSVNQH
jgi:hypothetical protein